MANLKAMDETDANRADPVVRKIDIADLKDALARGIDDFKAMPSQVVFLSIIYPILGLILARAASGYELLPLIFPLIAGFALLGPVAAVGLYELSRRREQGLETSWKSAFGALRSPSIGAIAALGLILMAIFLLWLAAAQGIYDLTMGGAVPTSVGEFIRQVFGTRAGWALIIVGNGVGFLFALLVLIISVVSFPLLLDRNAGVLTAVLTSARAVAKNPVMMAIWGLIVAGALVLGSLPFFVGLAVVLPVLGHATWHLYRKVVVR